MLIREFLAREWTSTMNSRASLASFTCCSSPLSISLVQSFAHRRSCRSFVRSLVLLIPSASTCVCWLFTLRGLRFFYFLLSRQIKREPKRNAFCWVWRSCIWIAGKISRPCQMLVHVFNFCILCRVHWGGVLLFFCWIAVCCHGSVRARRIVVVDSPKLDFISYPTTSATTRAQREVLSIWNPRVLTNAPQMSRSCFATLCSTVRHVVQLNLALGPHLAPTLLVSRSRPRPAEPDDVRPHVGLAERGSMRYNSHRNNSWIQNGFLLAGTDPSNLMAAVQAVTVQAHYGGVLSCQDRRLPCVDCCGSFVVPLTTHMSSI